MAPISQGPGRPMAEINVTPMVDVMLVLLIIFMVTAPLIQQGVQVALPQTRGQSLDVAEQQLVVSLRRDEKIYLGEVEIPRAELGDKLRGNLKLREDKAIYLHADRALSYGFVIDVMAAFKDAGVENLGMVTDPLSTRTP